MKPIEREQPKWLDKEYKFNLTEREKKDYEKMIMDVPADDIDWLIGCLLYARAKQNREAQPVEFKICDKCSMTFPYYTNSCYKCMSDNLRTFKIEHNKSKLLDACT